MPRPATEPRARPLTALPAGSIAAAQDVAGLRSRVVWGVHRGAVRSDIPKVTTFIAVLLLAASASCQKAAPRVPSHAERAEPEEPGEAPGFGEVMEGVGRRFEMAGRAMTAHRYQSPPSRWVSSGSCSRTISPGGPPERRGPRPSSRPWPMPSAMPPCRRSVAPPRRTTRRPSPRPSATPRRGATPATSRLTRGSSRCPGAGPGGAGARSPSGSRPRTGARRALTSAFVGEALEGGAHGRRGIDVVVDDLPDAVRAMEDVRARQVVASKGRRRREDARRVGHIAVDVGREVSDLLPPRPSPANEA